MNARIDFGSVEPSRTTEALQRFRMPLEKALALLINARGLELGDVVVVLISHGPVATIDATTRGTLLESLHEALGPDALAMKIARELESFTIPARGRLCVLFVEPGRGWGLAELGITEVA